jgi:hypothetical protein
MGKDRIEPCKCGHHHISKVYILPELTGKAIEELVEVAINDINDQSTE